jgi:hypothetical protein
MDDLIEKCCKCVKDATWFYAPSTDGGDSYCDDCIPRGCSCTTESVEDCGQPDDKYPWKWTVENEYYVYLDDQGRIEPCCEYFPIITD